MANIGRFICLHNRLPSVVGSRFCIGGGVADHQYCLKPFRSRPRSISPYHAQSTVDEDLEEFKEYKKQLLEHVDPKCPLYSRYIKNYVKATIQTTTPSPSFCDYEHVRATPLLDLLSVSVHSSYSMSHVDDDDYDCKRDQRPFGVYGTIQLIDVENASASYVYRRPSNKPDITLPGYNLTLINSTGSHCSLCIPRASAYKLRFNLKDAKFDGKAIAKGYFDLQLLTDKIGCHDKMMTQVVFGRNGFYASVQYATLLHAVVATVKVTLTKIGQTGSEQSESSHARIYGCISASSKLQQGNAISSVLLDKPPSDPLMVNLGEPFKLSRYVVAVPAYSSLEIKANLWDHHTNQQIATDVTLNFEAWDNGVKVLECNLGQHYHVRVQICWNIADEVIDNGRIPLDNSQISRDKRYYSASNSRRSQASKDELLASSRILPFSGSPLLEVFAIAVFPYCDGNSSICGTISIFEDDGSFGLDYSSYYLFKRDESNAVSLGRDMKIKSLEWPSSPFLGPCFSMKLHLSDDVGRKVCHGFLRWDSDCFDRPNISWYGKLISSVIRGEHGYATVHYAIFPNAVKAKIRVEVIPNDSEVQCMVGGNISAWYSKLYSSCSEKMFCRNTLFEDDFHQSIVSGVNELKLQKSTVAMPLDSFLVLGVKLRVGVIALISESPGFSKHIDSFDEVVDFKVDIGKPSFKRIPRQDYKVDVYVEWNKVSVIERLKSAEFLKDCLRSSP